jgi:exopolysaccharide production protein ExoZ
MQEHSKNRYLDILQIFRGIAALMVVVHHSVGSLKYYHEIDNNVLNYFGKLGKLGVDFFFILSGFIISYATYYKYHYPNSFKNYLKNRVIKVYVPYLPIGILMYLLYAFLPGFSNGNREISLFTSLTLFPKGNPALSVAWTLTFELCFYLFFSISFYSKKVWNYFVVIWLVLILFINYGFSDNIAVMKNPIFKVFFSPYNIEFIIGYILSLFIIHQIKISLNQKIFGLLTLFFLFLYSHFFSVREDYFFQNFLFAGLTFFILHTTINKFNIKMNRNLIMMHIGNASYSIYLIHNPLQMITLRLYPKINSVTNIIVSLILVLLLSSLFGYLYYIIFEKKCIKFVKSKITSM